LRPLDVGRLFFASCVRGAQPDDGCGNQEDAGGQQRPLKARGERVSWPSGTDRRAREIAITPKGRRVLQRARGMISQVEDEVLAGLTAAERRELLTLLRRALESGPMQPLWSSEEGD
jgi:hypothetical protein